LDPIFVAEHFDELQENWSLQDGFGNRRNVGFNKLIIMPILTFGWDKLRDFYPINMNQLISFTYLGDSNFQIKIFNGFAATNEYPRYHRLSTCITRDLTFQVTVQRSSSIASTIISFIIFRFNYLKLFIII